MTMTQWPNSTFGPGEATNTFDAPPSRAEVWLWRTVYLTIVAAVLCILAAIVVELVGLTRPHPAITQSPATPEPAHATAHDASPGTERRVARARH